LEYEEYQSLREELTQILKEPKSEVVNDFIDRKDFRSNFIGKFDESDLISVSSMVQFLSKCVDVATERSTPVGAFEGYNQHLVMLLDILCRISLKNMHPVLFDYLANSLDDVSYYVGSRLGQSFAADRTWKDRSNKIPSEMREELKSYAERNEKTWLADLLK
jgi:hypothetical protein